MDFSTVVTTRRSIRSYSSDPIEREILLEVVNLARLAPSAANRQPWRLLLVSSREWLDKVHAAYPRSWFMEAPHVLIVTGSLDKAWQRPYDGYNSLETDLAIVMDHIVLSACSKGIGTCWIANYEPDVLRQNLGLGNEERVFALTPLGWPTPRHETLASDEEKARKPLDRVFFEL